MIRGGASSKSQGGIRKPNLPPIFRKFTFYCILIRQFLDFPKSGGQLTPLNPSGSLLQIMILVSSITVDIKERRKITVIHVSCVKWNMWAKLLTLNGERINFNEFRFKLRMLQFHFYIIAHVAVPLPWQSSFDLEKHRHEHSVWMTLIFLLN